MIICVAFGIGFACLGVAAGVMSPIYPVSPMTGSTFGFKTMIIVVLGGKGSIPGAVLGGMIVGIVETLFGTFFSNIIAQILVFAIFVIVLLFRPNGLLSKDRG